MADAKPTGKLTTGAIGNFLLGGAAAIFVLTIGAAMYGGGAPSGTGAGVLGLVMLLFIIGGGICAGLGWFGMASLHGGTNALAGVFSILVALVPILMIALVMGTAESMAASGDVHAAAESGRNVGTLGAILGLGVPALLGIFGGLGMLSGKTSLAKPAGFVMLIGGIGCAALLAFVFIGVSSPTLATIALYVGFFGLALGCILSGAAMLGEKNA